MSLFTTLHWYRMQVAQINVFEHMKKVNFIVKLYLLIRGFFESTREERNVRNAIDEQGLESFLRQNRKKSGGGTVLP